jgi:outer membrane protein TolC
MSRSCKYLHILRQGCRKSFAGLAAWLLLSGVLAAQDQPTAPSKPDQSLPAPTGMPLKVAFPRVPGVNASEAARPANSLGGQAYNGGSTFAANGVDAPLAVRRVTLEEAQQMAAGASNPLVRLGQLQVEIAKQHRLGVQAQYFPSIGTTFFNAHLNKQTGQVLTVRRPIAGTSLSVPVNIFSKNQTIFDVNATQPVTPLFAIYQLVKIARADENIAKAKAGMPVAETASRVEKNYFDLLVAERELISAQAEAKKIQAKWLTASNSGSPRISAEQETDMIAAEKAVALPASKVKELTASLVEMVGLPDGTKLELVPPGPLVEDLSLLEVAARAEAANPEVVEAEQTAVKAHSGSKLSKMAYFPTVAIVGGYANQNAISNLVLPKDFSYIGALATWTVFDFGKREHGVKEANAQAEAADLGVQLTKAKVGASVKSSYLELERSRQLVQLARRMVSATRIVEANYRSDDPEVASAQAKMEAELYRAELEYRQSYARLRGLMGK